MKDRHVFCVIGGEFFFCCCCAGFFFFIIILIVEGMESERMYGRKARAKDRERGVSLVSEILCGAVLLLLVHQQGKRGRKGEREKSCLRDSVSPVMRLFP